MRPSLYTIDISGPGRLSTMAEPRGLDWLPHEMNALRAIGVHVLVSALTGDESHALGLGAERRDATAAGMEYISLPIPDRDVPNLADAAPTIRTLLDRLDDGSHIVAHCRFGIGRSSMIVAAVLVANGATPAHAWQAITNARGLAVPDTPAQCNWVDQFAGWGRQA